MKFYKIPCLKMLEITKSGIIRRIYNKKIKSQYISGTGYYMISININGKSKPFRVHRLLAITFIPNPNDLPHINHIDGNKLNNKLSNLEWTNILLNNRHAIKLGLINNTGENNGMSILKENQVIEIKKLLNEGILSQYKIAEKYNVSRSCILGIKLGRLWKHIK